MKSQPKPSITTPDRVEPRIGTLEFTYGMPSQDHFRHAL